MTNLDNLITRANNVLGALEGLIEGDAAETLIPDTSVSYTIPAIAFDQANNAWTLIQNTADSSDGLYKGLFTLALATGCAYLTIVSHNVTTPGDGIPARYQACGAGSFTDVTSMTTLNNKQIDKLEIRSTTPFEVQVKLTGLCEELTMPANTAAYTYMSGNTIVGITYNITISGVIYMGAGNYIDAFYDQNGGPPGHPSYYLEAANDTLPPKPTFNASHIYTIQMEGTGSPFGFRIHDGDGTQLYYTDNSGSLTIEICMA